MDASVIIPAYNCADTIGEQLDALAVQAYAGPFEVIIADNGSTDSLKDHVQCYLGKFHTLKIIDASQQKGAAHARNRGVEESESKLILFCDADDKVADNWVSEMVNALQKHPFVAPRMEHFEISERRYATIRKHMQIDGLLKTPFSPPLTFAGASGLGVRKELHEKIGGFDERFLACEDMDYCWRAQLEGGAELAFNKDALIHIRHRSKPFQWIKQAHFWGLYIPMIEKKFSKYGMKPPGRDSMIKKYKKMILNLNNITDRVWRDHQVWSIFHDLGKINGYIKYRNLKF